MDLPDAGEEGNDGKRVAHVAGGAGPVYDAHLRVKSLVKYCGRSSKFL